MRSGKPVQVYMPDELRAEVLALAESNCRTLSDEVLHAVRRHLEAPPKRTIVEDVPPLPPATVEVRPERKKRGRPPTK